MDFVDDEVNDEIDGSFWSSRPDYTHTVGADAYRQHHAGWPNRVSVVRA